MDNDNATVDRVLHAWKTQGVTGSDQLPEGLLRVLADLAAEAAVTPRKWETGDSLDFDGPVHDGRGLVWVPRTDPDGTRHRVCTLPLEGFQDRVGPVTEVIPPTETIAGRLARLGSSGYVKTGPRLNGEQDHAAVAAGGGQPETVTLTVEAVHGLVALCTAVATKLRALARAYKGPATKHATQLAQQCEDASDKLQELLTTQPENPSGMGAGRQEPETRN